MRYKIMARFSNLNPYEFHKKLINEYVLKRGGDTKLLQRDSSKDRNDTDIIKENHKFLWDDEETDTWEKQLAKRYYDKLFKEYCIADLSRYKENKIALRWRIEKEVVIGKGQFICGNKVCSEKLELRSWEVNFAYAENGIRKNALIKIRLCPTCSKKLNYYSQKREVKKFKRIMKKQRRSGHKYNNGNIDDSAGTSSSTPPNSEKSTEQSIEPINDSENISKAPVVDQKFTQKQLEKDCWTKAPVDLEEKSREEEFDAYLEELLL